jgi:hypothetical protein
MSGFQASKQLVRDYYMALDATPAEGILSVVDGFTSDDYIWRGMHPFYTQRHAAAVSEVFFQPLRRSFSSIQRRQDIFLAGRNFSSKEEEDWVCSMGHLMALFDSDWLGIPSTGKLVFLPYVEFHRISEGAISETASFCDIISLIHQAGQHPLPEQTGASIINPGPRTHDGLLFDPQDPEEGGKTLALIRKMLDDLISSGVHSSKDELRSTWHEDMSWFGPAGIGAAYTIDRYEEQHQRPFADGLRNIEFLGHRCFFAEENYGCLFGWASLTMNSSGGFMGLPASDCQTQMRLVDVYRREGDKLIENWIFIDLLHFLSLLGLDVLGRMKRIRRS